MNSSKTSTVKPTKYKASVMLATRPHPGWGAVRDQAEAVGFTSYPDEKLHVTVVFFGDSLTLSQVDDAKAAVLASMSVVRRVLAQAAVENPMVAGAGAFIPIRYPGSIGLNHTRKGSYVKADVEASGGLLKFRELILEAYKPHKVRNDFGRYSPHLTLAEGPPGLTLAREMLVPPGRTNATVVVFKANDERTAFVF